MRPPQKKFPRGRGNKVGEWRGGGLGGELGDAVLGTGCVRQDGGCAGHCRGFGFINLIFRPSPALCPGAVSLHVPSSPAQLHGLCLQTRGLQGSSFGHGPSLTALPQTLPGAPARGQRGNSHFAGQALPPHTPRTPKGRAHTLGVSWDQSCPLP